MSGQLRLPAVSSPQMEKIRSQYVVRLVSSNKEVMELPPDEPNTTQLCSVHCTQQHFSLLRTC